MRFLTIAALSQRDFSVLTGSIWIVQAVQFHVTEDNVYLPTNHLKYLIHNMKKKSLSSQTAELAHSCLFSPFPLSPCRGACLLPSFLHNSSKLI